MERKRTPLSSIDVNGILDKLQRKNIFGSEVLQLVERDLRYGITKEEIEKYLCGRYDFEQMKIFSKCYRSNCSDEEIAVICKDTLDISQMKALFEFYEIGIPLDDIKEILEECDGVAHKMRASYDNYISKLNDANKTIETMDSKEVMPDDNTNELLERLKEVVEKIVSQDKRYDELSKKIVDMEIAKQEASHLENVMKEKEEQDKLLVQMQVELDQAKQLVEQLNNEKKSLEEEKNQMEEKKKDIDIPKTDSNQAIPIYYQMPMKDANGTIIQPMGVEHTRKKTSGIIGVIEKLCFKKKSRANIVRLVASGSLSPEQLEQIKIALLKGIAEQHLEILINSNVTAERMKVIIEIAEIEMAMN